MPSIRFFSVMPNGADRIAAWVKELTADSLFPVLHDCISDPAGELTRAFDLPVAEEDAIGPRGYFIFGPAGVLKSYQILPTVVGFSSTELLRLVSALQLVRHGEMYAPADWQPGRELLSA
jgi:peroxiredoxin (alkyl hydroperoxide reductase subunit C)